MSTGVRYTPLGPSYLDCAVFSTRFQPQHSQSLRDYHSLLAVIGWGNTLKQFQALKRGSTAGSLVGNHATNSTEEDFRRSAVVKGTRFLRVNDVSFVQEVMIAQL